MTQTLENSWTIPENVKYRIIDDDATLPPHVQPGQMKTLAAGPAGASYL